MKRTSKGRYFGTHKCDEVNKRIKDLNSIKKLKEINIRKARTEIIRYLEINQNDMFAYFFYGIILEELKEYDEALEIFKKVADSDCNNKYSALTKVGDMYYIKKELETAKKYYIKAITESPNLETRAIYKLARIEASEEDYKSSLKLLRRLKTPNLDERILLARVLYKMGEYEESEKVLNKIHSEKGHEIRKVQLEKGLLEKEKGNYEAAKVIFIKLIEDEKQKDSAFFIAMNSLMQIEKSLNHIEEAERLGKTLVEDKSVFNGEVYLTLGEISLDLEKYSEAMNYLNRVLDSPKMNLKKIASYYLGMLSLVNGDYEKSIELLKNSLIIGGKLETSTYDNIIAGYIKLKQYDKAEEFFESVKGRYTQQRKTLERNAVEKILLYLTEKPINLCDCRTYSDYQLVDYNKDNALRHVIENHCKYNSEGKSTFSKDVDVNLLFEEVKMQMTEDNRINYDIMDTYEVDYPNCGYGSNGEIINKIKVVAIPNTKNILTMYPDEKKNLRHGELVRKLQGEKRTSKQISKFNDRFNKFRQGQNNQ